MTFTSAQANKLLKQLNEEYSQLTLIEIQSREFLAATTEDVESVRPEYDYLQTQEKLLAIEGKIRKVKHAINVFNTSTTLPGFNMTIDQVLIFIPQLTERKEKLNRMKSILPKSREISANKNIIDYRYANYDIKKVEEDYEKVSDMLSSVQTALDYLNSTATMEINML